MNRMKSTNYHFIKRTKRRNGQYKIENILKRNILVEKRNRKNENKYVDFDVLSKYLNILIVKDFALESVQQTIFNENINYPSQESHLSVGTMSNTECSRT